MSIQAKSSGKEEEAAFPTIHAAICMGFIKKVGYAVIGCYGSKGTITLKGGEVRLNGKKVEGVGTNVNNFAAEIKEFVTAIRENRQPMASGREVRPVIAVMEAIIKSAATHEVVEL